MSRSLTFRDIETKTPVLVLSAQNHGSLGIFRSLGRLGIAVHTVDGEPMGPASHSRYLRERFVFEVKTAAAEATVDYLLDVGRRIGRPTILIPTWDQTALLVSEYQDVLSERYLFPRQPPGLAEALADKKEMHFLARAHTVPTPNVVFPGSVEDVVRFVEDATFPVMLKGMRGYQPNARRGPKMVIVERRDELVPLYRELEDPAEPNFMLQEYIPGGEHDVWMFNGYFDAASDCLAGFTGRKLRQTPVYTGVTSLGVCEANDAVLETTTRWMKELGYRGVLDIGYRFDSRDGQYKVLDANPRIGATFRLFVARNGLDVARALYLDLTGQPVPTSPQVNGRKWILESQDTQSAFQYRRDGKLTIRQWAASLRGVQESGFFARDDLAPFVHASFDKARRMSLGTEDPAANSSADRQARADRHFASNAGYWRDIYDARGVEGLVYDARNATALRWVEELGLPAGTPVLDVGSGAGLTSVGLAASGFDVTATDTVPAMNDYTRQLASDRGLAHNVRAMVADVHDLPFDAASFDVAIALGVLPWLHTPAQAITEMARVVRPGGYVLVSVDNIFRLQDWLDPFRNPVLVALQHWAGLVLRETGIRRTPKRPALARRDRPGAVDALLANRGFRKERSTTIGFGPLTFRNHPIVSDRASARANRTLQRWSDRGLPGIREMGAHYLVLARKLDDV
jgi:D-aspartate ligase